MGLRPLLLIAVVIFAAACREDAALPDPSARAEGLYVYGTSLFLQGDLGGALEAFEELKTISPDDPRLPAALGEIYLAQSRLEDALGWFEKASRLEPGRSTNWSRIGFIQATLGRHVEARRALARAVTLNARDSLAFESLAELDLEAGRVEAAAHNLTLAAEVATTPEQAASLRIRAAQALSASGRRTEAIRFLQSAWGRGQSAPSLLTELGELLVREKRFEEARTVLTAAARRSEQDPTLWELVGELELALNAPESALEAWRASLEIEDRAAVRLAMARLHHSRNELAAGRRELDRALEVATGTDPWEMRELARALQLFDRKADALRLLEVLAGEPDRAGDVALQLETSRLGQALGRGEVVTAACSRVRRADSTVKRCP